MNRRTLLTRLAAALAALAALPFVRAGTVAASDADLRAVYEGYWGDGSAVPEMRAAVFAWPNDHVVRLWEDDDFWAPHDAPVQIVPLDGIGWRGGTFTGDIERPTFTAHLDNPDSYDYDGLFQIAGEDMVFYAHEHIADDWWEFRYL